MSSSVFGCAVVGCEEPAPARYLSVELARAIAFRVCAVHFGRIQGGERPRIVAERLDLPALDGRLALLLD